MNKEELDAIMQWLKMMLSQMEERFTYTAKKKESPDLLRSLRRDIRYFKKQIGHVEALLNEKE